MPGHNHRAVRAAHDRWHYNASASKATTHPRLAYRTRLKFETITIYNVKNLKNGWVEVDASGHGSRENFYFNRDTAEFACSNDEWRSVFKDPENLRYERTPLIAGRIDRLE